MAGVQFEIIGKNWQLFSEKHRKAQARMVVGSEWARK